MDLLRAMCIACGLLAAMPALADQKDPRLDGLFATLKSADASDAAVKTERKIWRIWFQSRDPVAELLVSNGLSRTRHRDYPDALKALNAAIARAPEFAEAWNRRAAVHYRMRNYELSLSDIERTLELEPRHFGALEGRGLLLVELNELESALEAFEEALALYPLMAGPKASIETLRKILDDRKI